MLVTFYSYTGDSRVANKNLNIVGSAVRCRVQDGCTLISPILKLEYDSAYFNANYFYINEWSRYYKMTNPIVDEGGRMYISGTVDPILSFWSEISYSPAMVTRQENAGITIVPDEMLPIQQNRETVYMQDIGKALIDKVHYALAYK